VLPVFFRNMDACLVTRRAFDLMGELNPQIRAKLRILASSPRVTPVVVGLRNGCLPYQKKAFQEAITGLGGTAYGRQILAVFSGSHMVGSDVSTLNSAREILNAARAIRARREGVGK
jgi:hypothetical protein